MPPVRMISNRLLVLAAVREMATLVPPRTKIRVVPACAPDREEPYGTDTRSAVLCDPIGRRAQLGRIELRIEYLFHRVPPCPEHKPGLPGFLFLEAPA